MHELIKKSLQKIKFEQEKIRQEFRERTISYVAGALSVVAGLAWNNAVNAAIEYIFPWKTGGILAKIFYAIIITLVVVVITVNLMRLSKQEPPSI